MGDLEDEFPFQRDYSQVPVVSFPGSAFRKMK